MTTLSGAIGDADSRDDDCFHVVLGAQRATLDGVTVTNGNANGDALHAFGGGLMNANADVRTMRVVDVRFEANWAAHGGAMFNWMGSSPTVVRGAFVGNSAFANPYNGGGGGAVLCADGECCGFSRACPSGGLAPCSRWAAAIKTGWAVRARRSKREPSDAARPISPQVRTRRSST